ASIPPSVAASSSAAPRRGSFTASSPGIARGAAGGSPARARLRPSRRAASPTTTSGASGRRGKGEGSSPWAPPPGRSPSARGAPSGNLAPSYEHGGGVYGEESQIRLEDCDISENDYSGVNCSDSELTLVGCRVRRNGGAGVGLVATSSSLDRCDLSGNMSF